MHCSCRFMVAKQRTTLNRVHNEIWGCAEISPCHTSGLTEHVGVKGIILSVLLKQENAVTKNLFGKKVVSQRNPTTALKN